MATLKLGQVVTTRAIAERMAEDPSFDVLIVQSLSRHTHGDWGDICESDKKLNDESLKGEGRILSAYTIDPSQGKSQGWGENTIWIITEWDRSVTTILYPNEY